MLKSLFCSLLLLVTLQGLAQDKSLHMIHQILARQEQAWNEGKLEAFMNGYWQADSLCFIGKKGLTYGWLATLANYQKSYPDSEAMGKLQFTILKTDKISRKAVYIIGKWRLVRSKDILEGHFSLLWKKIKGQWVIVADHSS